jgi:transposase-like protein
MGSGNPITAHKRAAIIEDLTHGKKLAQIARHHSVSPSTVKAIRIAEGLQPLPTDEAKANAAQARAVNMLETKRRRDAMEIKLIETAERLHGQLFAPTKVFAFGGREYGYVEEEIDEPDFKSKQALMISIGIALDKAMQLNKYNAEGSAAASAAIIELVDFLGARERAESA